MNGWVLSLALILLLLYLSQAPAGWRAVILLVIPVGFIQEPLRKLTPGQPVAMQLTVIGVFAIAFLAAGARFGSPTLRPLTGRSKSARTLLTLFIALTLAQSLHAMIRFGTPMVPMIGLLAYLLPIPALWVAYVFARKTSDIRRFLMLYAMAGAITTLSVAVSYLGVETVVFKQVGDAPMVVYHHISGVVELYCGFLRSPEVAAWHAAAAACAAMTIAMTFRGLFARLLAPAIVLSGLYTIILTGRRKALAILAMYVVIYLAGLLVARQRKSRSSAFAAIAVGVSLAIGVLVMAPESASPNPHLERGASTIEDMWDRFNKLGIQSIVWAFNAGGVIGIGTGAGAQGLQHIGGTSLQGSAEGGLGRIMLELGAPGLILATLSAIAVARTVRQCIGQAHRHSPEMFKLHLGIVAFIGANVPIFVGAAQIFGDPFVLLILGINLGFVLSASKMVPAPSALHEPAFARDGYRFDPAVRKAGPALGGTKPSTPY